MAKDVPRTQFVTWRRIFDLGDNGDDLDRTYAEMIATAINIRINLGLTQKEVSKRSGLSLSMVSKFETQQCVPNLKTFLKYMQGVGLDWEFILKKDVKK
ncbi:helix-turn-helix domain-containing protein [Clostridium tarantellae]|uniref:Helix-turn-helix domain-containing protein n=1 Tax=Clostridium tarantellae TaxID=39493 RepID=A0A6I1MQ30_9CLOT|nr:helix-turn-helix transcriptional regulator [Clostridium tarantellae]MPQ44342.1 helix-turn-helix domain-containing protein [Clostridium tarantellae]